MLHYLALVGLALAELSVYVLNAEAVAPANSVLESKNAVQVLASHFIGAGVEEASLEALAIAQLVPSILLDERNAAVVVVGGFDPKEAEKVFGSPLLSVANGAGRELTTVPRILTAEEIASVDTEAWPIVACNGDKDSLNAIANLKSKVMVIGVPAGHTLPELDYTRISRLVARSEASSGHNPLPAFFETEDKCIEATNDCSGRGSCVKSPNGYQCRCKATVKDGYTYNWGGSDCSKRNISWQFNLLMWTTIGITLVAILGVGALFSVGSEPLPGVLNTL